MCGGGDVVDVLDGRALVTASLILSISSELNMNSDVTLSIKGK